MTIDHKVKILKYTSLSAGNSLKEAGTSETTRDESLKLISIHVPKHLKPLNDNQLGHYLAGLIDGDGHFNNKQLVLTLNIKDISLAYYIKSTIGYGNIYKVKKKNAVILVVANKLGLIKILNLINGKIRKVSKLNQINNLILNLKFPIKFELNLSDNFFNHWLTGFSDADASFQIQILNKQDRKLPEVRLNFQIDQKDKYILDNIKSFLGGNIGYRSPTDTYYYGSTSFGVAKKVINYFDTYHLLSTKHIAYLIWRKVYIIIQNKEHLTEQGLEKIIKFKSKINKDISFKD